MKRRSTSALVAVVSLALAACGTASTGTSPGRSSLARTATPEPSVSQVAEGSPSLSVSQSPGSPVGISVVMLPSTYNYHTMTAYGALAVLDDVQVEGSLASDVILVDLAHGSWKVLATAASGFHPWNPVIGTGKVAWVEWRYEVPPTSGPCDWRIVVMDMGAGQSRVIASGVNSRLDGDGGPPPAMDMELDGTRLAYAVQDPTASRPWGWQIKVVDLATGKTERSVTTQEEIYDLGLSGAVIAYSEGFVNPDTGSIYRTRMMVSTLEQPTPHQIAADAYFLSFRQGRLAWMGDTSGESSQTGQAIAPRVWAASGPSWTPVPVTPQAPAARIPQEWPASSANAVSYALDDLTGPGASALWLWDARTGQAQPVPGSDGAMDSGLGGGWLIWVGGVGQEVKVSGMPLP